jgi:hypothetical protein
MDFGFTFILAFEPALAAHALALFPNAKSIRIVPNCRENDFNVHVYERNAVSPTYTDLSPEHVTEWQKLSTLLSKGYAWKNASELFGRNTRETIQLNLSDVEHANYLVLGYSSVHGEQALILAEFDLSTANYGMQREVRNLNQVEKSMIGLHFKSAVQQFLADWKQNASVLNWLERQEQERKQHLNELYRQKGLAKSAHERNMKTFIDNRLHSMSERLNRQIKVSSEGVQVLLEGGYDMVQVETILDNSARLALNTSPASKPIELDRYNLLLQENMAKPPKSIEATTKSLGRFAKAEQLLDRYEEAMVKVLHLELKPTGKNIGLHCSPAISNAAITDSVKKYSHPIYELLLKHPQKWPNLRERFRTIQNVLQAGKYRAKKMA